MAEKELRKMNRAELIEIIYALQQREQSLQQQIDSLEKQLAEKKIILKEAGNIAEAALRLNDVFAAAQAAADQYVRSVRAMAQADEAEAEPEEPEDSHWVCLETK